MSAPFDTITPTAFDPIASVALASVLNHSVDCVKLIGLKGDVQYMNPNGLCAMEIDDFAPLKGQPWKSFWPPEAVPAIEESFPRADAGETVRFKAFCPTAKNTPRWWEVSVSAVADDDGRPVGYLAISRDVTDGELAREALEIAAAELKHRLANTYAMISGLLRGFARGHSGNEAFADEMSDRIAALSRAQALFVTKDAPCEIDRLVPALLDPFERPGCPIAFGPLTSSCVDQAQADAIALTIGELAINSTKHGALHHGGEIEVSARREADRTIILWAERSQGPVPTRSREGGQGLQLMSRIVKARRGDIDFAWQEDGLVVTIAFRA